MLPGPIGSLQFIQAYAAVLAQSATTPQPQQKNRAAIPKENVSGQWVYIVAYGERGLVKIGTTTKPKQRLVDLQATSPEPLKVLAHFPGGRKLERRLHELFVEQRTRNEFFQHDELLDRFLRNIEFRSLPDAVAYIEDQKAWLRRPESERRAIERKRAAIQREQRKRGLVPIYPDEWNEARLEANRRKAKSNEERAR